ncbi:MAG: phosphoadenosine phosphosulfate reductase family protein [Lentisphaerae bacterium]|jgi:hypothetical protein|nr:phosphoadenosine phosphosulfate reductase family protein [Lentisphaerota bacterium]
MDESTKNPLKYRHILGLSGGKDSAALAIYMRDRVPEMEYVFCDTGKELPETYEYLAKLEVYLNKPVIRAPHPRGDFDTLLRIRNGFLPSPQVRWCTEELKIKPYEQYIGEDPVISYVGIRGDERQRKKYISTKPNIVPKYPFVEDGLHREDVIRLLNSTYVKGKPLGLPAYYHWRSRSGCFFCFFQQRREWVGLLENHPDLYEKAMAYERVDPGDGPTYTWVQGESLADLAKPERIAQIKAEYEKRRNRQPSFSGGTLLGDVFGDDDATERDGCLICHL